MKTVEELNALKEELDVLKAEVEVMNKKLAELTEEELYQVAGGGINYWAPRGNEPESVPVPVTSCSVYQPKYVTT